jgi:hypothetical protein
MTKRYEVTLCLEFPISKVGEEAKPVITQFHAGTNLPPIGNPPKLILLLSSFMAGDF